MVLVLTAAFGAASVATADTSAEVRAWEGTMTLPTYPWQDDVNPTFWALGGGAKLSASSAEAIIYPYVMQDCLSRTKTERSYKALFLENEYLRVTCLPELGGRLHSVFDRVERVKRCSTATK